MVCFSFVKSPPKDEKKQFTAPEAIKVPALFNRQGLKKRKSFVAEADVILLDGEPTTTDLPINDPLRKIGVVAKPTESLVDTLSPFEGQTWHLKSKICSTEDQISAPSAHPCLRSQSSTRSSYPLHVSFSDCGSSVQSTTRSSSSFTSRTTTSFKKSKTAHGVRNVYALEQALEALEEVESELKELKQLKTDFEAYAENQSLTKALTRLAASKKSALREKLDLICFEGDDSHLFDKLKGNVMKALNSLSNDWSQGGLNLTACVQAKPAAKGVQIDLSASKHIKCSLSPVIKPQSPVH